MKKRFDELRARAKSLFVKQDGEQDGSDVRKQKQLYPSEVWRQERRDRLKLEAEKRERQRLRSEKRKREAKEKRWQEQMRMQFEKQTRNKVAARVLKETNEKFLEAEKVKADRLARERIYEREDLERSRRRIKAAREARDEDNRRRAAEAKLQRDENERDRKEMEKLDMQRTDAWSLSLGRRVGVIEGGPRPTGSDMYPASTTLARVMFNESNDEAVVPQETKPTSMPLNVAPIEKYIARFPRIEASVMAVKFPAAYGSHTTIQGVRLNEKGGRALGKAISYGAFPHAEQLNLSWNAIRYRGCAAVSRALAEGACENLARINFQGNSLGDGSMRELGAALVSGLKSLEELNLSCNQIENKGALDLAHALFSGGGKRLKKLNLRKNMIGDQGATGLIKAACAGQKDGGGYRSMDALVLRDNKITAKCFRRIDEVTKMFLQI